MFSEYISKFNISEVLGAFIVLFAIIDIIGSVPIIINIKQKGGVVNASKAAIYAGVLLCIFFFAGEGILHLFHVDIASFAAAGAIVIFLIAIEMLLDIEIFRNQGSETSGTLVPIVFPLIAGAGSFTTLLSLKAEYADINILIALFLNMLWTYFVIKMTDPIEKLLDKGGLYMLRKFFGIILLAISVKLFTTNFAQLFQMQ